MSLILFFPEVLLSVLDWSLEVLELLTLTSEEKGRPGVKWPRRTRGRSKNKKEKYTRTR